MIDYARPTIMAEKSLKDLHNAMLENKHESAIDHGLQAIAEIRLAILAIQEAILKKDKRGIK